MKNFPKLNEESKYLEDHILAFLLKDLNKIHKVNVSTINVIHPDSVNTKDLLQTCPEVKDPRFLFGFGFSFG